MRNQMLSKNAVGMLILVILFTYRYSLSPWKECRTGAKNHAFCIFGASVFDA